MSRNSRNKNFRAEFSNRISRLSAQPSSSRAQSIASPRKRSFDHFEAELSQEGKRFKVKGKNKEEDENLLEKIFQQNLLINEKIDKLISGLDILEGRISTLEEAFKNSTNNASENDKNDKAFMMVIKF
jgi:hypothetical protein